MSVAWLNGRPARAIGWRDRGLAYGDGLFETLRVYRHGIALLPGHLRRLGEGCRRLGLPPPDPAQLRAEIARAARRWPHATLKLILTRGEGERGYRAPRPCQPNRLLICERRPPQPAVSDTAVHVRLCRTPVSENALFAGLKTLNRLDSVMARSEWRDPRIAEGLMRDHEGHILCGTMSNVFIVRQGRLITPCLDRAGVAGVMRRWVIGAARRNGIRVQEGRLTMKDIAGAQEMFLTNALIGIWSVATLRLPEESLAFASTSRAALLRQRFAALLERHAQVGARA